MTLEDHLGDVLRKARISANVSMAAAAAAAGISEDAYSTAEEDGRAPAALNCAGLGPLLDLDPVKLERFARGWLPDPIDTRLWRELRQITTQGPSYSVNCYLVWDEVTRDAALFDTGFQAGPVVDLIEQNGLQLRHIFITHTHSDHVAALAPIRERHPKARLHSSSKAAPVDQRNRATDFIHLGSLRINNRDTPGHADDGVTYIVGNFPEDAPSIAVVGDALFAGSMGGARDNLPLAKQKVREQIFSLPADTLICPGHGPLTTVKEQLGINPFFR